MYSEDNIPVNLAAPVEEPKAPLLPFTPISKKWKIFLGVLFFVNSILFLHTAYLYYVFKDNIAFMSLTTQSNPLVALAGFVGVLVSISVLFVYFYFRKRRTQEREDIPTSKPWKALFIILPIVYLVLAALLILFSGTVSLGLSVLTDSIIANFNTLLLLMYFDQHNPRKFFKVIGTIVIYVSLIFIIVGIVLQTLSTLSFFVGGSPQ